MAPTFRSAFRRPAPPVALLLLALSVGCASRRQEVTPARLFTDLGSYTHPVSTDQPLAQRWFDQGLRLAYGFNHDEAKLAFEECGRVDPECAMCWWGVAYTLGLNYNLPADAERDRAAFAAVTKARAAAHASEAERAYVVRYPENGWSLAGLATSLERLGDRTAAADVRSRLAKAWARADVPAPGEVASSAAQ